MSDLHDALQEVDGVGPAKADKILDVLDDHGVTRDDAYLEKAINAAHDGNYRQASVYLTRYDE